MKTQAANIHQYILPIPLRMILSATVWQGRQLLINTIPIFILIMSRAFTLTSKVTQPEDIIRDSLIQLKPELINEVALAAASSEEELSNEIRQRKLESIEYQQQVSVFD